MGNCRVTKLNTAAQGGSNLDELGFITLRGLTIDYPIRIILKTGCVVKSDDGTFDVSGQTGINSYTALTDEDRQVTPKVDGMSLKISKYSINMITNFNSTGNLITYYHVNLNDLSFVGQKIAIGGNENLVGSISGFVPSETLSMLDISRAVNVGGDITDFDAKALTFLNISNTEIEGDISTINTRNLETLNVNGSKVTGSITDIDVSSMENLNLANTFVTGDLQAMANKANAGDNGRKSGSIKITNIAGGEDEELRKWGNKTLHQACIDAGLENVYNPYIVFSANGVSLSATKPA